MWSYFTATSFTVFKDQDNLAGILKIGQLANKNFAIHNQEFALTVYYAKNR